MKFNALVGSLVLCLGITSPASAAPFYTFPVAGCVVTYSKYHHDYPASDIFAKKGILFY